MINKYSGISIILLAILSIIASWMMYKKQTKNFYVSSINSIESQQLIRDIKIKPEAFASLKIMQNIVGKLSEKTSVGNQSFLLALSPTSNKDKRPLVTIPTDKEKQRRHAEAICRQARNLNVSMSYISGEEKYAVVAGKLVREGQVMGNKFKIINIGNVMIKVQKNGVKCTIKMSNSSIVQL